MASINLDKNYNFVVKSGSYDDDLLDTVEEIQGARMNNKITDQEANFLINIVIKREFRSEAKSIIPTNTNSNEIRSLFMNLKTKKVKHA